MGGLFSSSAETTPRVASSSYSTQPTPLRQPTTTYQSGYERFNNQRISQDNYLRASSSSRSTAYVSPSVGPAYRQTTPQPTVKRVQNAVSRLPLMPAIYDEPKALEWNINPLPHGKSFRLVTVSEVDDDFSTVKHAFNNGAKGKNLKIVKIERVENPYLMGYYLLKKDEMKKRHKSVGEQVHFHGTKKCNLDNICENNFNWKLHGESIGNRYGKGISFSPISYYASHYSDKKATIKVMFYVRVLVSSSFVGNGDMVLPPKIHPTRNIWYDTAHKEDGRVIVKFSDNEFYPEFIIHYRTPGPVQKKKKQPTMQPVHYQYGYDENCFDYDYY